MTHGCIWIKSPQHGEKYDVLLHTYHTGMDIPVWVMRVPTLMANCRRFLRDRKSALDVARWDGRTAERFEWPQSVAAALIAVAPECLEYLPGLNDTSDLPEWGGQDAPLVLTLHSPTEWHLGGGEDWDEETDTSKPFDLTFNPLEMMAANFPEDRLPDEAWPAPFKYPDLKELNAHQTASEVE
jgi:hypothetical protein